MTEPEFDPLRGVVGPLILKILALEPMRRWGSARRLPTTIEQILQASRTEERYASQIISSPAREFAAQEGRA